MLPILLDLKIFKIYTFGVFIVLAFFLGSFLIWRLIRLTSFKEEEVFDGLFWAITGSLFIGRLVYVVLNFNNFGFDILKFLLINGYPGLSIYGMILGGTLSLLVYCRSVKIKFIEFCDYIIPPLFVILSIGKIGSFFSGSEVSYRNLIPIYEGLFFMIAIFLSYKLLFSIRREKYPKGANFYFFLWYFSLVYFLFDKLKSDHLYFLNYSFNKVVSTTLLLTFSFYFVYYFRSLIKASVIRINNYLYNNVKKTYKNLYTAAKKTFGRGKDKNN